MDRRAFMIGLLIWLLMLGIGGYWVAAPWSRPPQRDLKQVTQAETEKSFSLRLASLKNSGGSFGSYTQRIDEEDTGPPPVFDYSDWMWRECRNRFVTFFSFWIVCGFVIHWFMARIFEGKTMIGDVED